MNSKRVLWCKNVLFVSFFQNQRQEEPSHMRKLIRLKGNLMPLLLFHVNVFPEFNLYPDAAV